MKVGNNIKKLRKQKNLTQEDLAKSYFKIFKKLCKLEIKKAIRAVKHNWFESSEKQTFFQRSFYEEL